MSMHRNVSPELLPESLVVLILEALAEPEALPTETLASRSKLLVVLVVHCRADVLSAVCTSELCSRMQDARAAGLEIPHLEF